MAIRHDKAEIIEKALALISKGKTAKQAAKILGVPQSTLNGWIQEIRPKVNRSFNQPNLNPGSKPPKTVTIGNCINCGRPVVVAKFIAERATWEIKHCSRECRNGTVDVEEEEAI